MSNTHLLQEQSKGTQQVMFMKCYRKCSFEQVGGHTPGWAGLQ